VVVVVLILLKTEVVVEVVENSEEMTYSV